MVCMILLRLFEMASELKSSVILCFESIIETIKKGRYTNEYRK
jgi:hypothetical protein